MKENLRSLKVGDTVWLVGGGYRHNDPIPEVEAVVTKVGRKYITAGQGYQSGQFDIETGREKADFRARHLYIDIAAYRTEREADDLYHRLRTEVRYSRPTNMTADEIRQAAQLLRIDLKEE